MIGASCRGAPIYYSTSKNTMKHITSILLALLFPILVSAQFNGEWKGKLLMGQSELALIFKFEQQDSIIIGTLDVPQQGAKNLPIDKIKLNGNNISLVISAIGFNYEGSLNESTSIIEGSMSQNGYNFPLNLEKHVKVNRPQTPQPPFPYLQEEVVFYNSTDGNKFAGTLVKPLMMNNNTPIAILISGSGQQNRDEELMEHKPFLVIADHLARNGIATLRYDDRGIGGSEGKNLSSATTATFKDDALSAINFLKSKGLKNIGVIGHSEGGLIAFMLGAESADLKFIISLAGTAVSGDQILIEQNRLLLKKSGIPTNIVTSYCDLLKEIYTLKHNAQPFDRETTITELKAKYSHLPAQLTNNIAALLQPQPWIDFFISYDPTNDLKNLQCRTLALNGENDVQVIATQNIKAIKQHIPSNLLTTKTYPTLNHLFQHSTTGMPNEYYQIEETISTEILSDITKWIKNK